MEDVKSQLTNKASRNTVYIGSALINALFLILWAFIQFGAAKLINMFITEIEVVDKFNMTVLYALRFLIAISTLYPIGKQVLEDIHTINIQSKKRLQKLAEE